MVLIAGVRPVVAVLAHQGGWDELLLLLAPMAVVVALLRLAKKRVDRDRAASARGATHDEETLR